MAGSVAVDLADLGRRSRGVVVHRLGEPSARPWRGATDRPRAARQPWAAGRADIVLLSVPVAGGSVLCGAVVSLGRAGALGDRDRCPAAAALGHAAACGRRDPKTVSPG